MAIELKNEIEVLIDNDKCKDEDGNNIPGCIDKYTLFELDPEEHDGFSIDILYQTQDEGNNNFLLVIKNSSIYYEFQWDFAHKRMKIEIGPFARFNEHYNINFSLENDPSKIYKFKINILSGDIKIDLHDVTDSTENFETNEDNLLNSGSIGRSYFSFLHDYSFKVLLNARDEFFIEKILSEGTNGLEKQNKYLSPALNEYIDTLYQFDGTLDPMINNKKIIKSDLIFPNYDFSFHEFKDFEDTGSLDKLRFKAFYNNYGHSYTNNFELSDDKSIFNKKNNFSIVLNAVSHHNGFNKSKHYYKLGVDNDNFIISPTINNYNFSKLFYTLIIDFKKNTDDTFNITIYSFNFIPYTSNNINQSIYDSKFCSITKKNNIKINNKLILENVNPYDNSNTSPYLYNYIILNKDINTIMKEKKISLLDIYYLTKYAAKPPVDKDVFGAKIKMKELSLYKKG